MAWAIEGLQLVWFAPNVQGIDAKGLYSQAFGRDPDSYQSNRSLSPASPFLSLATSTRDNVVERVQVGPGRVELHVSAQQSQEIAFPTLPGDPHSILDQVPPLANGGSDVVGNAIRVALVTNLVQEVQTADQASDLVGAIFGLNGLSGSLDASFQMNRRKPFVTSHLQMNRLLRLNSVSVQGFAFAVPQPGVLTNIPTSIASHAAQYMIDLNVAPTGEELSPATQKELFKEMLGEAHRILNSATLTEALA